jgi:hypothetical protein
MGGCSSWEANRSKQEFEYIDGKMRVTKSETVKAKQAQYFTDSERTAINFVIRGLGTASIGTSQLDAESLAEIIKALPLPVQAKLFELLGVMP